MPRRMRELQAQASETMRQAQALMRDAQQKLSIADKALLQLVEQASGSIVVMTEAIEEFMDGVTLEAEIEILGQKIPAKACIKVKPRETEV